MLNSPAYQLIATIAFQNWPLLLFTLLTNFLGAILEGSTIGLIYVAVSVLSGGSQGQRIPQSLEHLLLISRLPKELLFFLLIGSAVVLQILLALSNYGNKVTTAYLSARAQPQVTGRIFEQIMTLSFPCASNYKIGDLVMFANDAAFAVDNQIQSFNNLIVSLTFNIVYAGVLISLSPVLALVAVLLALTILLIQRRLLPKLTQVAHQLNSAQIDLGKQMTENIQALRLLHTFGTQQRATENVILLLKEVESQLQKRARIFYLPEPILDVLPILTLAILAALSYGMSNSPEVILPMLVTFLLALQRLAIRLRVLVGAFTQLIDNSARIHRLNFILDPTDKQFSITGGEKFENLQTDISFEDVTLSYMDDESSVLHGLNFAILRNQVTALVGQSGAGKSSIIDLLIGLYQTTSGHIKINGKSLHQYSQESWREHIGVVSQDTFIFNSSILDNLRYGKPDASYEAVVSAAKAAQSHQFILDLPDGYETIVGERGYRLSGGQRQRIALARAILKQPEILILDEATSALDSESERLIQQALGRFQHNRTVIVVAHRLSTIMDADQILVFERGRLVEKGSHRLLLQKQGHYSKFWRLQSQEKYSVAG
jgi:ATP-binding cassette subfamily B protein/subfamily B ATP-binding cassette protein MsbA